MIISSISERDLGKDFPGVITVLNGGGLFFIIEDKTNHVPSLNISESAPPQPFAYRPILRRHRFNYKN